MTNQDGPLSWLPRAQMSQSLGVESWMPFQEGLTALLESLGEEEFVICNVSRVAPGNRKYLQFLMTRDDRGRHLIAEASALKFQGTTDTDGRAQEALIDRLGWTRDTSPNHQARYAWPSAIGEAVTDSLQILRDIWRLEHPSEIALDGVERLVRSPLAAAQSPQELWATLKSWVQSTGGAAEILDADTHGALMANWPEGNTIIRLLPDATTISIAAQVGRLHWTPEAAVLVLEQASALAIRGCPTIDGNRTDRPGLFLVEHLPIHGLSYDTFTQQTSQILVSNMLLRDQLASQNLLV